VGEIVFRELPFRLARAVFFSFALILAMAIYCLSFGFLTFETHLAVGVATIPIFTYFSWKNLENQVFPHARGLEGWVAVVYWIAKNSVMILIGWPLVWTALILSPEISYFLSIPHNRRIWLCVLFLGILFMGAQP